MTVITLPKILRDRLTEEGADAFVQILDKVEDRAQKATLEIAEERFEKRIAQLETKIAQTESRIILWMFLFWVGQLGSMTALLFAFLKH